MGGKKFTKGKNTLKNAVEDFAHLSKVNGLRMTQLIKW
jgi:hypothetical protein